MLFTFIRFFYTFETETCLNESTIKLNKLPPYNVVVVNPYKPVSLSSEQKKNTVD